MSIFLLVEHYNNIILIERASVGSSSYMTGRPTDRNPGGLSNVVFTDLLSQHQRYGFTRLSAICGAFEHVNVRVFDILHST